MSKEKKPLNFLQYFAETNRGFISFWRAKLLYQIEKPFISDNEVFSNLNFLEYTGAIEPVKNLNKKVWKVAIPFVETVNNVYELANEAYPTYSFSFSTALEIHNLTDQRFNILHMYGPIVEERTFPQVEKEIRNYVLPTDTQLNQWNLNKIPKNIPLKKIDDKHEISIHRIKKEWFFGIEEKEVFGVKVKTTDLERTLIDGLRTPKYCGGLNEVFKVWVRSLSHFDTDKIIEYVERIDSDIIYQRVGFVLEELGINKSVFEDWKKNHSQRGGSRRLNPTKQFSNEYHPEWLLSINHPISILSNKDAEYS